ncbi:INO80 [Candida theae]|uniref:Chromatin-remodeling ATPase INO80 n=1 Tax=Candida theae TaxID=1198502 RepID=A0AAD5BFQ9_9ASCO|nr:INO80 [Candida theae]KAI5958818.1 INO80 [Candida theae]
MNILSMLSNDGGTTVPPSPQQPPQEAQAQAQAQAQELESQQSSQPTKLQTQEQPLPNYNGPSHEGHGTNGVMGIAQHQQQQSFQRIAPAQSQPFCSHYYQNGNGQPQQHMSLPTLSKNESIVSSILPSDNVLPDFSDPHPKIDQQYKSNFENNINIINQLDKYQRLSHDLKLLKFDEAKLNNYLVNTHQFAANYIDRVVAEDISSRANKISDTNKNKELVLIDYSKPLHHNSTRGKEYKWGSTREIHKVDHKSRKKRPTEEQPAANGNTFTSGNYAKTSTSSSGSNGPVPIRPKSSVPQEIMDLNVRRSSRPKAKRKTYDYDGGELDDDSLFDEDEDEERTTPQPGGDLKRVKVEQDGKQKSAQASSMTSKEQKAFMRQYDTTYISIWKDMSRKDGPKVSRLMQQSTQAKLINLKKTCLLAAREAKRWQLRNTKNQKDLTTKARRAMREMFNFWKRNERIERELKKKHEKELTDKAKKEEEDREAKRQSRKLNFLITQTELYSHFIGKKIKTDEIEGADSDPRIKAQSKEHLDKFADVDAAQNDIHSLDFDNDDEDALHRAAAQNAQNALVSAQNKAKQFDDSEPFKNPDTNGEEMNFQNPTLLGDISIEQPKMLKCTLKEYQIKGLNWLANLYEQGINGILADEMGLGKTVQSISVLAYLAETHNIWGPYLVVTPSSTLHNWQQEISKFVPQFKVLPYWGHAKDRKVLRKFWDRKSLRYDKDAPFHVLVTSYQLIVSDIAYFQKMKWQYMILDEAQAIKSSQSSRWKSLLSLSCRNRLLLTGTPIQNSMQELWALLHFIMPTLFDSHDEFSDWFSKDIESHAQSNTGLDEQQLRRLHMILKPFMLRRIKKNVQSELGDKVEIDLFCDLTNRQKKYYQMLKSQISIMDLLDAANSNSEDSTSLVNLVMQFRKVCNHPDLFERADVRSPFTFGKFAETSSFLREGNELEYSYSTENEIKFGLPRLIYDELLTPNYGKNTLDSLYEKFNIYNPENTKSLGWTNEIGVSLGEIQAVAKSNTIERAIDSHNYTTGSKLDRVNYLYEGDYVPKHCKLLIANDNELTQESSNVANSPVLTELCSVSKPVYDEMYLNRMDPAYAPVASAPPVTVTCSSTNFTNQYNQELFNPKIRSALAPMSLNEEYRYMQNQIPLDRYPPTNMLPNPINKFIDYSNIRMPSMDRFITESGKLAKLDELLVNLKQHDHRVLIYFQMTKMMDLMEEYLTYRQHKYIRLDGSSKLDDRRDLVHDWQTKPEIFVFLLSTRAGGLGINLTAADTVIFYDSDWNPTIDSQAMDRAHRLGQTRQVTVYRLLTRNTIEERMRDRAKQKEQVQQVVMEGKTTGGSGGSGGKEETKNSKKDAAFLLLGDGNDESSN